MLSFQVITKRNISERGTHFKPLEKCGKGISARNIVSIVLG